MDKVTEKEARHGKFEVFKLETGKSIKAKIRSMNDTEDWLDDADKVLALGVGANGRASQRAYNEALADCVFGYDPEIQEQRDELERQITPDKLYLSFESMRYRLDPFLSMKLKIDEQNMKEQEQINALVSNCSHEMLEKLTEVGLLAIEKQKEQ